MGGAGGWGARRSRWRGGGSGRVGRGRSEGDRRGDRGGRSRGGSQGRRPGGSRTEDHRNGGRGRWEPEGEGAAAEDATKRDGGRGRSWGGRRNSGRGQSRRPGKSEGSWERPLAEDATKRNGGRGAEEQRRGQKPGRQPGTAGRGARGVAGGTTRATQNSWPSVVPVGAEFCSVFQISGHFRHGLR